MKNLKYRIPSTDPYLSPMCMKYGIRKKTERSLPPYPIKINISVSSVFVYSSTTSGVLQKF